MVLEGLRPTPRLLLLLALGLLQSSSILISSSSYPIYALVGLDLVVFIAFVVDATLLPSQARLGGLEVFRDVQSRLSHGRATEVAISVFGSAEGFAVVIDEPGRWLVPKDTIELQRKVRLLDGKRSVVRYPICPRRRGQHDFGPVNLLIDGPLRLARRRVIFRPKGVSRVHVYPDLGGIDQGALDPGLMMAELGIKRVRRRSEGTEFESLREANPGDELRRIDWRATARRGKPIARNYTPERNHEVLLCVDTGRLMGAFGLEQEGQTKLDHAICAAIRLAAVALKNGDRVGLMNFDVKVHAFLKPDRGRPQLGRIIEALHDLEPMTADASFIKALGEVRQKQRKRALIIFLTDFVDLQSSSLMLDALSILSQKHVVLFVALADPRLKETAEASIEDLASAYRSLAAMSLDRARAEVIEGLNALGVRALDLPPGKLSIGAIQAYLALRGAGRI